MKNLHSHSRNWRFALAALGAAMGLNAAPTFAVTPAEMLAGFAAQSGRPAQIVQGQQFFNSKHGREWSCSSCHGTVPVQTGKHAATGKAIAALAPAANAERFADAARTEKWFRRNCNDVMGRECTPAEKADVLAWLLTLKP
jgi:hypothetical protein